MELDTVEVESVPIQIFEKPIPTFSILNFDLSSAEDEQRSEKQFKDIAWAIEVSSYT
jgi:hypothetical protein